VTRCELAQTRGQQLLRAIAEHCDVARGWICRAVDLTGAFAAPRRAGALQFDPRMLAAGKTFRLAPQTPARNRDADAAVVAHANHVAPRARMPDKLDRGARCFASGARRGADLDWRHKRERKLHQWPP
jgi:hypothetical protein